MFGGWAALLAAVALAVGLLTLFSMTKIWGEAFWKRPAEGHEPQPGRMSLRDRVLLLAPIAALAVLTLCLGFFPGYFFSYAELAAAQLLDPQAYINAVLAPAP
jgi:multicomponent Na+:H+ antiporter subunit D